MKRTYFHGTCADNLQSILKNGISCTEPKLWNCSQDAIYLWEVERVAEYNGEEDEDWETKEQRAFQMASESGQHACSSSADCRVVVVKIELDDDEIQVDNSCENMDYANCIYRDILPSEIVEIKVSNDLKALQGYFIGLACSNELSGLYFSDIEQKIGKALITALNIDDVEELIEFEVLEVNEYV